MLVCRADPNLQAELRSNFWDLLCNWLTLLLGADRIAIYDFNVPNSVRDLLLFYANTRCRRRRRSTTSGGLHPPCRIDIIPWPLAETIDQGIWYHGQSIAIQDCLYRHMAVSQHVMFNDVDEFLVPHQADLVSWNDVVAKIWQPNFCGLQFVSAFYSSGELVTNILDDDWRSARREKLTTMSVVERSAQFSTIRTKCLVKPYLVFEAGIHHISKPIWANLEVHRVSTELAYLHHYRTCVGNLGMNCFGSVTDKTLLIHEDALKRAVDESWGLIESSL